MPKKGSQLHTFMMSGLRHNKYINLEWRTICPVVCTFTLEHMHKRNKKFSSAYFSIYEDYYALKKPNRPMPNHTKVKGMLDSALKRKGSKYIRFLGKEGRKSIYEIDNFMSRSNVSSPTSSSSTSDDEPLGNSDVDMQLKDDLVSSTTSTSPDRTLSPDLVGGNLLDSFSTNYINSATTSSQVLESEIMNDIENLDFNEIMYISNNGVMDDAVIGIPAVDNVSGHAVVPTMVPELTVADLEHHNYYIPQNIPGKLTANPEMMDESLFGDVTVLGRKTPQINETSFEDADIGLGPLLNGSVNSVKNSKFSVFSSNELFQDATANKENKLMQGSNIGYDRNKDDAVIGIPAIDNVSGHAVVPTMVPELTVADLEHHNYCERSLDVQKHGNEYTFIFKTVTNSLPLNDAVFLYLSKLCSPA